MTKVKHQKEIIYCGQYVVFACDGKCNKAWGVNTREKKYFDENEIDDFAFLADDEIDEAPENPGTYEGGDGKPAPNDPKGNKWCVRECERAGMFEPTEAIVLPDFSKRFFNMPDRHPKASGEAL